jgi:hypothetical protein
MALASSGTVRAQMDGEGEGHVGGGHFPTLGETTDRYCQQRGVGTPMAQVLTEETGWGS